MNRIIECVPNFSEGRNPDRIKKITDAIENVSGIRLLGVDSGRDTNRTVVTFVGEPENVVEAAFRGIKKAAEVINMQHHSGEHPRFGATDVCPLVPVAGVTMNEVVEFARKLAKRVGDELEIPVYCYEFAAFSSERKSLAKCRAGEYESLKKRMESIRWRPDFGPVQWNNKVAKSGATVIGARNFLIAYNINLNTTSTFLANEIAYDIRESGRILNAKNTRLQKIKLDKNNEPLRIPGILKHTKAIGWFIKEFGIAQVSMNLTNISVTPIHVVFDEVCKKASEHGVKVTGSELVGLIPLQAMLNAGKYFLQKENLSTEISDRELVEFAIKSLGLDELGPFDPHKKILEFQIDKN